MPDEIVGLVVPAPLPTCVHVEPLDCLACPKALSRLPQTFLGRVLLKFVFPAVLVFESYRDFLCLESKA